MKKKLYDLLESIFRFLGIDNNKNWVPFLFKWFFLSFVIHVTIAIFSTGFFHFDEHYQILEFLGVKLHMTPANELPWEYQYKMRSWTQAGLYFLIAKCLGNFGIENPVMLAFYFRLFTSLTGWLSLCTLGFSVFFLFENDIKRKWAIILSTLTWYIPFIQTRASSEGLGTNVFILGLSMMIWGLMKMQTQKKFPLSLALASGVFFGLSFTFRFQLGLTIMFSWFWAFFFKKMPVSKAFSILFGIVAMIFLEVLVDYWGFGTWTFTPWNYLYQNLILNKASDFATFPWYYYFTESIKKGIFPLSLLLVFSQVLFWIKKPRHLISWATFPLFLVHTLIARKALRFLFPIAVFIPLTLVELPDLLNIRPYLKKKWIKISLYVMLYLNIILLIIVCLKPTRPIIGLYDYVYKNQDNIKKIYLQKGWNPYHPAHPIYFYRPHDLKLTTSSPKETKFWYFVHHIKEEITRDKIYFIDNYHCRLVYLKYPLFILKFNIGNWQKNSTIWGLFQCQKGK